MKIKHVITTLALAGLMGAGAFAGIKANQANEVQAAASDTTIYLDLGSCNWASKSSPVISAHYWNGSGDLDGGWPGTTLTKNKFGLYEGKVDSDALSLQFTVNGWGGDCQTETLSFDASKTLWTITTAYTNGTNQKATSQAYTEKTIYVLDKGGNRLQVNHYAHVWRNGKSANTGHPGVSMTKVGNNLYSATIPTVMDRVIFNNNEGNETSTLTIDGECSVLESDWDGSKWTKLLAAQFVDQYMKFDSIDVSNVTQGTDCKEGWDALYTAYTTTYASVQGDIVKIKDVADRLAAWAEVNGRTLNKDTGAISSQDVFHNSLVAKNSGNTAMLAIIISSIAVVSVLGVALMIKRRKEDR